MPRVKGGTIANKRRKNLLERAKGFRHGRSKKKKQVKEALLHAGKYAFNHRRDKKGDMRSSFIVSLNAALREGGYGSYSKAVKAMKDKGVALDRKILSTLAKDHPEIFARVAEKVLK